MVPTPEALANAWIRARGKVIVGLAGSRAQAQAALSVHPLTPSRVWDTRVPSRNPTTRTFAVRGLCGTPTTAQAAITVNTSADSGAPQ